ncbi:SIR2 family protein [Priestia megaterium]|uniref:SIR2 family NAD-dependent protein deacylase n=1 Tax=Priestia megaterium TaxID=1404 RepID=UPI002E1EEE14|nr:SIR2 family protein [Priestia megaterium]
MKETETVQKNDVVHIPRKVVFEKLFNSFNYGNLGMFVGAGFSKAVIGDEFHSALSWFELIKTTSNSLEIAFPTDDQLVGVSLPELATSLCKSLAINKGITYSEAKSLFKNEICKLTNWLPTEEQTNKFKEIMEILNPSWIITTNYDLVLETLLTGKCKSLGPNNYLSSPRNIVPIYHFHGTRLDPDSIIVTQEDYIPLFRPNEYRQSKLAMTIRESTTLILGYGLGDMNVLSAVDWSKNIYTKENEYPHEIVQVVWTSSPQEEAYTDENGNLIIEMSDLEVFLNELILFIVEEQEKYDSKLKTLDMLIGEFEAGEEEWIQKFIDDRELRLKILKVLSEFEYHMISSYIPFFTLCINKIWETTSVNGAFDAYNKYLNVLLDIIVNYDYKKMPPRLFQIIAQSLDRVLYYVDRSPTTRTFGNSWSASDSWHDRKNTIPKDMITELYEYARQNLLSGLIRISKDLI